ncbi:MAG: hypothetical protein ABIT08_10465 [Bacteroidia bacterium]
MIAGNVRLIAIVLSAALLLLIPLIGMQFTDEVKWDARDFIVAGVLLLSTGLACELVFRKFKKTKLRVAICVSLLLVLFLIWAELAVGLFGTPLAGS